MNERKKKFVKAGVALGIVFALVSVYFTVFWVEKEKEPTWHKVAVITPEMLETGEYTGNPAGASGWLATFLLDYAENPTTVLANNNTDWSTASTAMGYVDADNQEKNIKSEDPFYFVVRCRFNDTVKSGGNFIGSRCRCTLTVSGDETISGVTQYGDQTGSSGGGVVSQNSSSDDFIWINFYWDDNNDGYRITDDGSLDWSITIEAKY